jgi:hypothetical protein
LNLQSIIQQVENEPGIEFQTRCSFCNGLEEAFGSLGVQIAPGDFMELPIGPKCLETAQSSSVQWVDNPTDSVVE